MMLQMIKWKRDLQEEFLRNIQNLVLRVKRKEDEEKKQAIKKKDVLQEIENSPIHREKVQGKKKDKRDPKSLLLQRNVLRPNPGEE